MAAKIDGVFELNDHSFDFTAIAFGRIGGQNIGAQLSDDTKKTLSDLGYNCLCSGVKSFILMPANPAISLIFLIL